MEDLPFLTTSNFYKGNKINTKLSPPKKKERRYKDENPKFTYYSFKKKLLNEDKDNKAKEDKSLEEIKLIKVNKMKSGTETPIKFGNRVKIKVSSNKKSNSYRYRKEIKKIVSIQAWWKIIYKIIKVQKNVRKFLSKINLLNKRKEIEKLKNIKHKYLIRWLDITNKRIILKKLNIYNFERMLKNKNNYKKIHPNKLKTIKITKEGYNMDYLYKNNSIEKKKPNYLLYYKNSNINSFTNKILPINKANSYLLESNKNSFNRTKYVNTSNSKKKSSSRFKSKSKSKNIFNNSQEKSIPKESSKIIFFHKDPKIQIQPLNIKNNYKKILLKNNKTNSSKKKNISPNKDNITNFKYNNNNYTLLKYQGYNTLNKKDFDKYKRKLNYLINLKKCYECWKTQIIKIKTYKKLIKYLLLKKSLMHFHFMIYGKSILEKLISYKKNKIVKDYFIHIKKRILISIIHSISVWAKFKKIFYNLKKKVFIIDLKNILYNIKEIIYINNNDNYSNRNKSISFKKGNKIFNNININNYYNNNNFINLNKIKFNNYLGNMNQAGLSSNIKFIKKNKSCEKRKCKNLNSNISANIRQNNSTEKRFKINDFKFIEAEMNNMKRNKKNNKTSLNSFSVGDSNLVIHEKNLQYTKLNIFFKIYSKFLRKRLMYNCIKIWKENIRINNLDKKIINKKIKLNEKLIKIIKSGNNTIIQNEKYNNDVNCNNNSNNNNINNKILQNNVNVYYKKRIILNLDEPNYQGKNILTGLPVSNTINNNENEKKFIMTERNNSKLKLESDIYSHTEENMSLKNKIIEEKEIHFDKKIKRKLQYE